MGSEASDKADGSAPRKGVGRRARVGITWTLGGEIISNILRIAAVAVLGRCLTKSDFGVVAGALTIVLFANRFREFGLALALVQRKHIDDDHVATTWAISLLLGVTLWIALFAGAGPLAALLFPDNRIAGPLRALSLLFLLGGVSITVRALCTREMRFRALAIINVVAYGSGTLTSIVLAVAGLGLWALVIGSVLEASLECLLLLVIRRPSIRPRISRRAFRDLIGFGTGHTLGSLANWFATQGDNFVVGRYLGAAMLGLYDRAYVLTRFPAQVFSSVAGSVLFSSFSRIQEDPERLGAAFRRVLFANAICLMPASAGLIVLAPEATRLLLGPAWDAAVLPFQIMSVSMLFRTSYKIAGLIGQSAGGVRRIAVSQVVYGLVVVGGALTSMRWGIGGVATTTTVAVALHFVNLTRVALRHLTVRWAQVLASHADGFIMALLAIVGSLPITMVLRAHGSGTTTTLVAGVVGGAVLPCAFAALRIRRAAEDWMWVVERVRQMVSKNQNVGEVPRPSAVG
jgi:O-antigen/teichoic acid export membrane protein